MSSRRKPMYSMPCLVNLPPIEPSNFMYKVDNIHVEKFLPFIKHQHRLRKILNTKIPSDVPDWHIPEDILNRLEEVFPQNFKERIKEREELETRQKEILSQLKSLKDQVATLRQLQQSNEARKSNENNEVEDATVCVSPQKPVKFEVVVHANLNYPPYSILALQKLWANSDIDIRVTSYKHYYLPASTEIIASFEKKANSTAKTIINLILIWTQTKNVKIVKDGYFIIGESNLLRYLSRLTKTHNYEKIHEEPYLLDMVLDWCYKMYEYLTNGGGEYKEMDYVIRDFEKWSNKRKLNIADIALWSLFKQFPEKNRPKLFNRWYELCEKTFMNKISI